jgi:hypothetical protein
MDSFTFAKINQSCQIEVSLDYISPSAVIGVQELFRHIDKCSETGAYKVSIKWLHEDDDDSANVAMNYQKLRKLNIVIKSYRFYSTSQLINILA